MVHPKLKSWRPVGIEMSGGPGTVAARFAMNIIENKIVE